MSFSLPLLPPLCHSFLLSMPPCCRVRSFAWAAVLKDTPAPVVWALQGPQFLQLWHGVLQVLQGGYLLQHSPLCGLQGNVCSDTWYLLLLLQLSPQGYFSHIFPHPSLPGSISPFSKCIFLKGPPPWLQGSAMPCNGATEATWKGLCPAQSSPGHSSQRSLKPPCLHLGTCTLHIFNFFPILWSYCIFNSHVTAQVVYKP